MSEQTISAEDLKEYAPLTAEQVAALDAFLLERVQRSAEAPELGGIASHDMDAYQAWRSWPERARATRQHRVDTETWGEHVRQSMRLQAFDIAMLERRVWRAYAQAALCSGKPPVEAAVHADAMMLAERERFGDDPKPPTVEAP